MVSFRFSFTDLLAIFICLIVVHLYYVQSNEIKFSHTDGQPKCLTEAEFGRRWRNNEDPTRYWQCQGLNDALSYVCPTEYLYQDHMQGCVYYSHWIWTLPFDPPVPILDK